jgi:hypothetical protein
LEARIRDLEQQLEQRERNDPSQRMPGLKPTATPRRKSDPRKRRAHGFSRRECPTPTEQVVHAVAVCPRCATPLGGGTERWRKEVLELPAAPVRVIQHIYYLERCCPTCGQRVVPPPASPTELGVLSGRQRLGLGLLAYLALLRTELRLPIELIQWALQALHGLELDWWKGMWRTWSRNGRACRADPTLDRKRS